METNLRTKISIKDICNGFVYNDFEGKGLFGLSGRLTIQPEYQRNYIYADGKKDVAVMITKIFNLFKKKSVESVKIDGKMYATMGWDFYPTTTKGDGYVLPRSAEKILRSKYYPTGKVGEFPVDPETGKKLEINPF